MRSLRTANSFTSRNISSAPPARTLMLYHYSGGSAPSQGTRPQLANFCAFLVTRPVQYSFLGCSQRVPQVWFSKPGSWSVFLVGVPQVRLLNLGLGLSFSLGCPRFAF